MDSAKQPNKYMVDPQSISSQQQAQQDGQQQFASREQGRSTDRQNEEEQQVQMGVPMGIPVQRINMQPGQYHYPQQMHQYQHFTQQGMEYIQQQPVISENSQQEISYHQSNQQSFNNQRPQMQQQIVLGPDGRQYIRQHGTNNLIPIFPQQQREMMGYQQQNSMQYREQMNEQMGNQRKQGGQKIMVPPPNLMTISQQRSKNNYNEYQYPPQQYNQYPYQMAPQMMNQQMQMMGRTQPGYFQYPTHPEYPPQPVSGPLPSNAYQPDGDSSQPSIDWQKKFFIIFERYQIQYHKFEVVREQYQELCKRLEVVDSQDEWNDLKNNHNMLFEKLSELTQEMASAIVENQHLAGQTDQQYDESWQHRYNQLLQDYKNMRNDLDGYNQNEARQQQTEAALEELTRQYQQLERNHSELISQYNNLVKEIKEKELDFSSGKEYESKLEDMLEQNMRAKQGLEELHMQNEQLRDYIKQMQQKNKRLERQYPGQFNDKISKQEYNQALTTIREQSNEINKLRSERETIIRNCNRLEQENELKDIQIQKVKERANRSNESNESKVVFDEYNRILQMKSEQINQYKQMLQNLQEDFKISIQDCEQAITKKYEDKISNLNKEIKKLSTRKAEEEKNLKKKSDKGVSNMKIDSYQKKINYYEQQVNNLNQLLNKKNQELIELRGESFQIEKAKNIQADFESVKQERDQLKEALKNKNKEIESLKLSTSDLQTKIKIVSQKSIGMGSRAFIDDVDNLNILISKKQSEIIKIRQVVQNKQNIIQELENQIEKQKMKIFSNEKKFQLDKQSLQAQISHLQNRNNDLDKKIRHLQFDYGDTMKNNLQQEINTLRSQNQLKQQTIIRYQNQEIQLNGKITNLQRAKKNTQEQVKDLREKLSEFDRWKQQYNKYMQNAARQLEEKDEEIKALQLHEVSVKGQFSSYKAHANEIENTLKTKNDIIKNLQLQIKSLNQKLSNATRDCQNMRNRYYKLQQQNYQEMSKLNAKLKEKELLGINKQRYQGENESGSLIRIVDILKQQNQRLKRQLARSFDIDLEDDPKNSRRASQGLNYIQQRLWEFNSKLDQMMGSSSNINYDDKGLQATNNDSSQVQALKQKVKQLQQYCASLQVKVGDDAVIQPNPRNAQIFIQQQQQHTRQINFFKQKCSQFENRAQHLLKVNQQLKARVQNLLKPNSEFSPYSFYRQQLLLSEQTIEQLNQKVKKLTQQNRNNRKQANDHHSKLLLEKQETIYKLQTDIQSLNRTIKNLQLEKTTLINQKTDILHQVNQKQHQFSINEATLKQLIQKLQMKVESKGSPKKVTLIQSPKKQKPTYSKIKVQKVEESQSQTEQFSPQRSRLADQLRTVL